MHFLAFFFYFMYLFYVLFLLYYCFSFLLDLECIRPTLYNNTVIKAIPTLILIIGYIELYISICLYTFFF